MLPQQGFKESGRSRIVPKPCSGVNLRQVLFQKATLSSIWDPNSRASPVYCADPTLNLGINCYSGLLLALPRIKILSLVSVKVFLTKGGRAMDSCCQDKSCELEALQGSQ